MAIGGIDYVKNPGAGTLRQLAVYGALRSCGIGTILIGRTPASRKSRLTSY